MKKQPKAPTNGKSLAAPAASAAVSMPQTGSAFSASTVELARRMRFNPLRMVSPENLAAAHDHFDLGYLWQGALFWDAMIRRDDTLSFVVPQLQNAVAQKPWGVQKRKNADPVEAARHAAALQYFYDNVTAVDAFDKNIRGDRHLLLKQMGLAHAMRYAVHHFVWKPSGKTIEVEGGAPVPALSAEMEYVPLWFFENTSGTLRLLRHGGYGGIGEDCNWEGEWMVTSGEGMMFAAAGCYIFKRLTFQDWTIYNERYGQQKVIGMTTARADSDAGRALTSIVQDFNGDMGIALHECQSTDKPPISLLGPEGTASVDVFERFLDRQDEKMTVMFRGGGQANIASKDNEHGISSQINETEALEMAHCANIASACRTFIDRNVIRYCFGEGVEPLAWFGLPDMDNEDAQQLRDSAGFIADRGGRVDLGNVADRLGVPMLDENADEEDVLQPVVKGAAPGAEDEPPSGEAAKKTANSARLSRLQELVEEALRTANYDPNEARDADGKWATLSITPRDPRNPRAIEFGPDGEVVEGHLGHLQITTFEHGVIGKMTAKTKAALEEAYNDPAVQKSLQDAGFNNIRVEATKGANKPSHWTAANSNGTLVVHPRTAEYIAASTITERKTGGLARVIHHEAGHAIWDRAGDGNRAAFAAAIKEHPEVAEHVGKIVNLKPRVETFSMTDAERHNSEVHAEVHAMRHYAPAQFAALPEKVRSAYSKLHSETKPAPVIPEHLRKLQPQWQ